MNKPESVLLPCPFCGSQPEKIKKGLDERFAYADEVIYKCKSCGCSRSARGNTSKPGYADNSTVDARALAAWNTRAEVEKLRQAQGVEAVACKHCEGKGYTKAGQYLVGCLCQMSSEQLAYQIEHWASTSSPLQADARKVPQDETALYRAAIDCPHEIEHDKIVLHFSVKQPGHNALNQLGLRLNAAFSEMLSASPAAPTPDVGIRSTEIKLTDEQRKLLTVSNPVSIPGAAPTQVETQAQECPNCDGKGFLVKPNYQTGEPEMEQCRSCFGAPSTPPIEPCSHVFVHTIIRYHSGDDDKGVSCIKCGHKP